MSTRIIGATIMVHGDDRGLRLPPRVAPIQAVIIPIIYKDSQPVIDKAKEINKRLAARGVRVHIDDREGFKPGWKYSEYEMMGVPLRIEIGQKDLEKNQVCLVRRDTLEKMFIAESELEATVDRLMSEIQKNLFAQAKDILENKTFRARSFDEFVSVIKEKQGMADLVWCGATDCETKFKAEAGATIRCSNNREIDGNCVVCGKPGQKRVFVARAY
jgi:prolyl-tRNA synthetase